MVPVVTGCSEYSTGGFSAARKEEAMVLYVGRKVRVSIQALQVHARGKTGRIIAVSYSVPPRFYSVEINDNPPWRVVVKEADLLPLEGYQEGGEGLKEP